jgi:hypothetical protein
MARPFLIQGVQGLLAAESLLHLQIPVGDALGQGLHKGGFVVHQENGRPDQSVAKMAHGLASLNSEWVAAGPFS